MWTAFSMIRSGAGISTPITTFVQKDPLEGATPTEHTEDPADYDDNALYVGARMYRTNPRSIRRAVTRRDGDSDAEVLVVSLDTYLDRRTAYSFALSSGGVRKDYYHSQDSEDSPGDDVRPGVAGPGPDRFGGLDRGDADSVFAAGFTKKPAQVWGLQIKRALPDRNETNYWVLIPKAATGFPSHFGYLRGIGGIRPSRRFELVPYTAGDLALRGNVNPADPSTRRP